ncbi:MAG: chromosome partition protein MukF, partial [Plesiomonas shigelloides]
IAVGDLPPELEYESLSDLNEQLAASIENLLIEYRQQQRPLDLAAVLKDFLRRFPGARHFDVSRLLVDQAVRLGVAKADFAGLQPEWQAINDHGAKVQAHVIDEY